jgi:ribosomal protein L9
MKETKIFLTEEENTKLIEVAKENGQSKVMFCTVKIRTILKKLQSGGKKIKKKKITSTAADTKQLRH